MNQTFIVFFFRGRAGGGGGGEREWGLVRSIVQQTKVGCDKFVFVFVFIFGVRYLALVATREQDIRINNEGKIRNVNINMHAGSEKNEH